MSSMRSNKIYTKTRIVKNAGKKIMNKRVEYNVTKGENVCFEQHLLLKHYFKRHLLQFNTLPQTTNLQQTTLKMSTQKCGKSLKL